MPQVVAPPSFIPGFLFWTAAIVSSICSLLNSYPNWLIKTILKSEIERLVSIRILRSAPFFVLLKVRYPVSISIFSHLRSRTSSLLALV
jgi:hypothetical protein